MTGASYLACGLLIGAALAVAPAQAADPDPQVQYQRRVAERSVALFKSLDLDGDGTVSRAEAQGDLNFTPRFDDMDIDRDGRVTAAELQRFIQIEYGLRIDVGQR
jgi:hypothetical protein